MEYASTQSLRLLESFSVEYSSRSDVVNAEGIRKEESESEDAVEDEKNAFLADVMNKKSCIQDKLFGHASKLLLKKDLDTQENMMLKYDYLCKSVKILWKEDDQHRQHDGRDPERATSTKQLMIKRQRHLQDAGYLEIYLGYEGYLYSFEKKESITITTLVKELVPPTKKSEIEHVLQTINALFILKNHVLKLVEEVGDQEPRSRLRGIVRRKESMATHCQTPRVMVSPKLKKKS
ncbi:hypothetical protein G6F37_008227 [Rhizopus arrhizus]|nr:hypothetical protein G6F38_009327 [Rhizopus arrhizus]KAG1155778.1 hypothetical protein G6F37_008227 [Rhizopus arrhizus]